MGSGPAHDADERIDDEDPPPDSSVRMVTPVSSPVPAMRTVVVSLRVSEALRGVTGAHVTLTLASGEVLYEDETDEEGQLALELELPVEIAKLKVLVETSSGYRTAVLAIGDEGFVEHGF